MYALDADTAPVLLRYSLLHVRSFVISGNNHDRIEHNA